MWKVLDFRLSLWGGRFVISGVGLGIFAFFAKNAKKSGFIPKMLLCFENSENNVIWFKISKICVNDLNVLQCQIHHAQFFIVTLNKCIFLKYIFFQPLGKSCSIGCKFGILSNISERLSSCEFGTWTHSASLFCSLETSDSDQGCPPYILKWTFGVDVSNPCILSR